MLSEVTPIILSRSASIAAWSGALATFFGAFFFGAGSAAGAAVGSAAGAAPAAGCFNALGFLKTFPGAVVQLLALL